MYKKLEDIIHYIVYQKKDNPENLGATKLNKILWFIDIFSFLETGKKLTDTKYIKRQRGPVPEWKSLSNAMNMLISQNKIKESTHSFHGYKQTKYTSDKDPNIEFHEKEKILIDDIIDIICNKHSASSISELSHNEIWDIAKYEEELPIYTCLVHKNGTVTEEMKDWALACIQ